MATDSRTLKLAILGEVKDLSASLNKGTTEVQTFGDKITKFGKVAGAAFAEVPVTAPPTSASELITKPEMIFLIYLLLLVR